MTGYYLQLAWQNLRRSPWLAALIVLAVAVGIGSSMTVYSLLYAMSRDPIPQKSSQLFTPWFNVMGDSSPFPSSMTWRDARALREENLARRQAVMYPTVVHATTGEPGNLPVAVRALATHADMFTMFGMHFLGGNPWSAADDAAKARVTVLSAALAERLFPGADPVGRTLGLDGHSYRVIGVTETWAPWPRFHTMPGFGAEDELFVPVEAAAVELGGDWPNLDEYNCVRVDGARTLNRSRQEWLDSECVWVTLWVELSGAAEIQRYTDALRNHAEEQRRLGRFSWPVQSRLYDVRERLGEAEVVPDEMRVATLVAFGFLLVCLINAVALMLARFDTRSAELRLRRALGASRAALFRQCLAETALLGAAGGILGALLVQIGRSLQLKLSGLAHAGTPGVDATIVAGAVLFAVVGTVLAGLYPALVVSRAASIGRQQEPRRGRFGAGLVAAQIALTLGIVANALHISWQRVEQMRQPSGADERNVFSLSSSWSSQPSDLHARVARDIALLRGIPGVIEAAPMSNLPMMFSTGTPVFTNPEDAKDLFAITRRGGRVTGGTLFFVDEHALGALGLRPPVSGRWFNADEVGTAGQVPMAPVAIITRGLAERLFPGEDAAGKTIYLRATDPVTVVGVLETLRGAGGVGAGSILRPLRYYYNSEAHYVVRTRPGRLREAMLDSNARLAGVDPARILLGPTPFADTRAGFNRRDRALVAMLLVVCGLLIVVIALGIVGLTHYWMSQHRVLIGIRRALGAPRGDILLRFHTENIAIVGFGAAVGIGLAVTGNLWLVKSYAGTRLAPLAVVAGAALIVLLCQFAVFWPALRASMIPPALATRAT